MLVVVLGRELSGDILESFALKLLVHQEARRNESNEMKKVTKVRSNLIFGLRSPTACTCGLNTGIGTAQAIQFR